MNKQHFLTLLSRKLSGGISLEEDRQLQECIAQEESYRQIADELTRYFEQGSAEVSVEDLMARQEKLKKTWELIALAQGGNFKPKYNYKEVQKVKFFSSYWLKIAAVFVLILGSGILTFNFLNREPSLKFSTLSSSSDKVFKTLDDGTKIYLNRGSSIRYSEDFGKRRREIFLEGEAFFDVVKNKAVPLFIHVRNLHIEVKGTAFNVNAYQQANVEVLLVRGSIAVSSDLDKGHNVLLKPNEKLIAAADPSSGRQVFDVVNLTTEKQFQEIKWTQDSLLFRKEKLKDLALRLEKKYAVNIEIRNEELKQKRFSGIFATEDLKQALEALKLSYPFTYTINNKLVIIK